MIDTFLAYAFRLVMYVLFGLTMETVFAVDGIDRALGYPVHRRVPKKYLEGFVSLYMVPLHGFGLLLLFEPASRWIAHWPFYLRYVVYAVMITLSEVAWGWILDKTVGFYSWDYYAESRYKVFKRGYTLWTLVPLWGIAGMLIEQYTRLMVALSPHAVAYFHGLG